MCFGDIAKTSVMLASKRVTMNFMRPRVFAVVAALLLAAPTVLGAFAQGSVADFVKSSTLKPSIAFSEVDASYKVLKIKLSSSSSEGAFGGSALMMMSMMGGPDKSSAGGMMLLGLLTDLYWSKGDALTLSGHEYLVTYKLEFGLRKDALEGVETAEAPFGARMRLALVRSDMITSISPDPDNDIATIRKLLDEAKIPYDKPVVELNTNASMDAAILMPVFSQAKGAAKQTATLSNAKQVALGMMIYGGDYDDVLPWPQGMKAVKFVTRPYLKNDDLWKSLNPAGGEFRFNMSLGGVSMVDVERPAETILFYEEKAWPDGRRAVAFVDGHAKFVSEEDWKRLQPTLKLRVKKTAKRPLPLNWGTDGT